MREYKFNIDDWTGGNTIGKSMGDAVSKDYTDLVENCLSAHTINVDTTGLKIVIYIGEAGDYVIDWGDGNVEDVQTVSYSTIYEHVYENVGMYTIIVDSNNKDAYVMIQTIYNKHITEILKCCKQPNYAVHLYNNMNNLVYIDKDAFSNLKNVTALYNVFNNSKCTNPAVFTYDIFRNMPKLNEVYHCFNKSNYTVLPDNMFSGNQKLEKIKKSFNDLNDLIRRPTGLLQTDDDNIMEDCFNNHTDI